jgi:hypothetical protein
MAVIGALFKRQTARDDIARQLAPIGVTRFAPNPAALIAAATAHEIQVVVLELQDEAGRSSLDMIETLAARAKGVPVIVYDQLSPWRVDVLREILVRRLPVQLVPRPARLLARTVRGVLQGPDWLSVAPSLLRRIKRAPTGLDSFLIVAALQAPQHHNVSELALWSGSTLRTVERRLTRAGWASPRTVVQAIRALDVVWLMSEYRMSTRQVQTARRFAHPTNIRRLTKQYANVTPAAIRVHNGFAEVLDTVVERITHRA